MLVEPRDPVGFDFDEEPHLGAQLHVVAGVRDRNTVGAHASTAVPILGRDEAILAFEGASEQVRPGALVDITPVVSNLGDELLPAATMELLLPDNGTVVSAEGANEVSRRRVVWDLGDLPGRQRASRTARVKVRGRNGATASVVATLDAGEIEEREHLTVRLDRPPAFEVELEAVPGAPVIGEDVMFRFLIHNRTGRAQEEVHFAVQVPDYFEPDRHFWGIGERGVFEAERIPAGGTWQVEMTGEVLDDRWPWATEENVPRPGEALLLRAVVSSRTVTGVFWQETVWVGGE